MHQQKFIIDIEKAEDTKQAELAVEVWAATDTAARASNIRSAMSFRCVSVLRWKAAMNLRECV